MARTAKKKFKLTFHTSISQASASQEPQELRHKSTQYTSHQGQVQASTSYLSTKAETPQNVATPDLDTHYDLEAEILQEDEGLDPAYVEHLIQISTEPTNRRKRTAGDDPLKLWLPERDRYLEELLTLEGRGHDALDMCPTCPRTRQIPFRLPNDAKYECLDCFGRSLQCGDCLVRAHQAHPFHRIRLWNGEFFVRTNLKSLGLRVQLGHPRGIPCSNPQSSPGDDFVVIDVRGIHSLGTLSRLTDNTGTQAVKDRYPALLLSVRQWRYLKMMKRAARGHDPNGAVAGTKEGDCAVLCPACPHYEINLPEGWEKVVSKRWLYALYVGIDANFRLKRKHVSSDEKDPDLGQGFAYFVEDKAYKAHCEKNKDTIEPKSNCSRHDAVNLSNAKPGTNHAATGVGTIECARHNMKRPNAVGDLQFHERYYNMDYLFWKSLQGSQLLQFFISYDIVCQWSINLRKRMFDMDHEFLIFDEKVYVKFVVPKFHLPAHVIACRTAFSLNYTIGAGRTDGEAPERGWAEINPLASSTKEMGPGSRRDALDAHFGDYNWRKVVGMGTTMYRKARAAAADMADHIVAHNELTASLPHETVKDWLEEVESWEKGLSSINPYNTRVELPTQAAARHRMAEAEAADIKAGKDISLDVDVTPSVLISMGLDLEAEQRSVKLDSKKVWDHSQDRQKTRLQLRMNTLSRKLAVWGQRQQLYIPSVAAIRQNDAAKQNKAKAPTSAKPTSSGPAPTSPIYEYPLYLPSSLLGKAAIDQKFAEIEWSLRLPQADESIESVRRNLQMRAYLWKFKEKNVRGQHANTRARNAIANVQARIDTSAEEYRAAQIAIVSLGTLLQKTGWQQEYLKLEQGDIRELSEVEDGVSAGRSMTSWIWRTKGMSGITGNDELFRDALRLEWCKSRARSMRFTEEVALLSEEMARVLRFFSWQEKTWLQRAEEWSTHATGGTPYAEGLIAYARRQARLRVDMTSHFKTLWLPIPKFIAEARARIDNSVAALQDSPGFQNVQSSSSLDIAT
ncbi:hypothetical protein DXG01_004559 [Tephrocybe rancida]|nr:hypothetical protein DXG01_004559 [Tephrocybe rancida]